MIESRIRETIGNLENLAGDDKTIAAISEAADMITGAVKSGNKLMICGNGGSAADAQHMAGEYLCRFYKDRAPLPAIALSTDSSVITSISNNYSYSEIFSRQVEAIGKRGDVLLGISTSGSSKNVLKAFEAARRFHIDTILITGALEKDIALLSDITVKAPSIDTSRIQEIHLFIEHIICEIIEDRTYGEN